MSQSHRRTDILPWSEDVKLGQLLLPSLAGLLRPFGLGVAVSRSAGFGEGLTHASREGPGFFCFRPMLSAPAAHQHILGYLEAPQGLPHHPPYTPKSLRA